MPETRDIRGGAEPSTSWPAGYGNASLEAAIVRPYGTNTRTITNTGSVSCEYATMANDGTVGTFTTLASGATTTVTQATGPKFFRQLGSAGPTTLRIDLP